MQFRQSNPISSGSPGIFARPLIVEGGILLLAALLRLWALDLKPAHFDEGINGWFVDQMRANGYYKYDPANYHGPIYFYGLFVSLSLLGRNLWALRLPAVLSSIASIWVALRFDRYVGAVAARWGALALALSPAAVFYSRYAIHESWMVLSLLITTRGIFGLWKEGERRDLIAAIGGITLMLLIKETAVIHSACFLLAAGTLVLWERVLPSQPAIPHFSLSARRWTNRDLYCCCGVALFTLAFFYSGTFFNPEGIIDFFRAYANWFHTGTGDTGHVKTEFQKGPLNYYWLYLMALYEWPALLGLLYAVRLVLPAPAMVRYLAIYGVGTLVAYSIVPYKTPWCIISIIWPFALLFGCAVQEGWALISGEGRVAFLALGFPAFLLGASLFTTLRLNFRHFADPTEPYVYVQTMPEINVLTHPVLGLAARDARNYGMDGEILVDSYYPLPWMLGDFTGIGYFDKTNIPAVLDGDFIMALTSDRKMVEGRIRVPYLRRRFHLRDAMDECTVWFKESLFHDWFAEPGHGSVERVVPLPSPSPIPIPTPQASVLQLRTAHFHS